MTYTVIKDQIVHITHNDADALGCALVVDMYRKHSIFDGSKKGYIPVHNFLAVTSAKENIKFIINLLNSIYTANETGFDIMDISEEDMDKFEYMMSGFKYNPLGVIAIPGEIIISDLALDSEILDKIEDIANKFNIKVLYVDHHTSNLHNHQRYLWCYVTSEDETGTPRSACKQMLDLFRSHNICSENVLSNYHFFEKYINDISRYDTWMWKKSPKKKPDENHTSIIIDAVGGIQNAYDMIHHKVMLNQIDVMNLRDLPGLNSVISADELKIKSYIETYMKKTVYSMGYNLEFNTPEYATLMFALVILPESYGNDIMENIYMNSERHVDVVIGIYPNSRTLSFRKNPDCNVDLSVFAKKYGGGGHKDASGAKLDTETFLDILNRYYTLLDKKNH